MQRISPRSPIFLVEDLQRNVFPKFIENGHQHGGRKPAQTSVTEVCYKSLNSSLEELKNVTRILFCNTRTFLTNMKALSAAMLSSCQAKA